MGLSHSATMDTIRQILDDDANTELSALHKIDIHQVAHAMKAAIRYSEETLVTYEDYQVLFLNQGKKKSTGLVSYLSLQGSRTYIVLLTRSIFHLHVLVPQTKIFRALFGTSLPSIVPSCSTSSRSVQM